MSIKSRIKSLLEKLPHETLYGARGRYLTRYTLLDFGKKLVRVKIHNFHRGDEDVELHNHPWSWAISLILKGGYWEERLKGNKIEVSILSPGDFNLLLNDTFHRVIKAEGTWSLFITGPEVDTWFFLDPSTHRMYPWRQFIANKGLIPVEN